MKRKYILTFQHIIEDEEETKKLPTPIGKALKEAEKIFNEFLEGE